MPHRCRSTLLLLVLFAFGACATQGAHVGSGTSAPPVMATLATTATPTTTEVAWQTYQGTHFTFQYPPDWTAEPFPLSTGQQGENAKAANTLGNEVITFQETDFNPSDLQNFCAQGATATQLAGLPMRFVLGEGVHRTWFFVNSQHESYMLDVMDANQSQTIQAAHDAILKTFHPNDTVPGCPA